MTNIHRYLFPVGHGGLAAERFLYFFYSRYLFRFFYVFSFM